MSANESNQNQPSLVGGHAEYVKGAAQATIGAVTGSHAWTSSGERAKAHAVSDMKAAGEARQQQQQQQQQGQGQQEGGSGGASGALGRAEGLAGKAVGCEGMVKEGEGARRE